jgi:flagellar basal body-associated protein FliL
MSWLHDPAADEDLSRIDEELTRAGHTATPGGRRALHIILLVYLILLAVAGFVILKPLADQPHAGQEYDQPDSP